MSFSPPKKWMGLMANLLVSKQPALRQDYIQRLAGSEQVHSWNEICFRAKETLFMKTNTYLRFSLLIPFLVWGVCLLFLMIASTAPLNELASGESGTIMDWIMQFLAFYVFGIVIWLFSYAVLALILLALSFISRARVTMKVFALSPLAMTLLTIAAVNLFTLGADGDGAFFPIQP